MRISVSKRRFINRLIGYGTNPAKRALRVALKRDQPYRIGGHDVVLPPEHDLPYFQSRDVTYDSYAIPLVAGMCEGKRRALVIDLGGNVGDTAVAMLSASDIVHVISVEGSPHFAAYARRNLAPFGDRAHVIEAFVGPGDLAMKFEHRGGTGGFITPLDEPDGSASWVFPDQLLAESADFDLVIWKSDIDGFDVHLIVNHWDIIDNGCDAIWFEYDPSSSLVDRADLPVLIDNLATSGRRLWIYDNLGRLMLTADPGSAARETLTSLTSWLQTQRDGHVVVPYVDVWALRD